ncbi:GGDEF domain-containing protein [Aquisalimonas lutea]|uniref:GGDEF domain-containing protein n=1 Tax=Aquisalimonas lutea TaxID=1327750 RepID=UPI0025B2D88C|nr:GGDEF domain-containing protein [Aquisalimonas lutea]MDN3518308.1 GGDEF domain-containing protein [Aquisalimonas lutea]
MAQQHGSVANGSDPSATVIPLGTDQKMPVDQAWQVVSRLMGCLELESLIATFREVAGQLFDCAGVSYTPPDDDGGDAIVCGDLADHQAQYGLRTSDDHLGVLTLHAHRPLGAGDLARVEQCIGLLVTPLRNALRYEAALRQARTDPLSGLLNRTTMHESLAREVRLARRHDESFCILSLDLDDFKAVNDTYGHAAGDTVLQDVAALLGRCARESDLLFRVGGDEFMVALSHTSLAGARLLAERIRRAVSRTSFTHDGEVLPVHVSVGVTALQPGDTVDGMLRRVDGALYSAKNAGRDQVVFV